MPVAIVADWSEDESCLFFVLHVRGARVKAKTINVTICDVYVKVNVPPSLFDVDLPHEIDPEHPKTTWKIEADQVTLTLKKREPGLWHEFRAQGPKAELRERRKEALAAHEAREQERLKRRDERKEEKLKAGEHEQWRLDRENKGQIEQWEQEEKERWEKEVYDAFDEETSKAHDAAQLDACTGDDLDGPDDAAPVPTSQPAVRRPASPKAEASGGGGAPTALCEEVTDEEAERIRAEKAQAGAADAEKAAKAKAKADAIWTEKDLDDTEEYVPEVRGNPGKVGIRFTERPRPGVPVRDRGQRAPPHPKKVVKSEEPPMIAGDEPQEDENDPVWLKDKADKLMVDGDYQGAYNAYTEALKLASNARAFANRAVACLYLGSFEQCLEDCNRSLNVLDFKNRVPTGQMPAPPDPEDQRVRARVEIRIGTAYLWLGALSKAEEHFQKALDAEDGLDAEQRTKVKEDLASVQNARAALVVKEKADGAARAAHGGGEKERGMLGSALALYDEAVEADANSSVVYANRCFARLRAGDLEEAVADTDKSLQCLKRWPTARRAPKPPALPSRLDPPYLDDPTFKHPDEQKQGEVDWLMKHNGGSTADLPPLPIEYEWIRDAAEKSENAWIAVRKKLSKATIDAIRRATMQLQDALYLRQPALIREHIAVAIEANKHHEGPSNKAIHQAQEYATKLEEHAKVREAEREKEEEEERQELEDCDLEQAFAPTRTGLGQTGFGQGHPVEKTRRRLYVKVLLRRARAMELLGQAEEAAEELRRVLRAEPENPEAKQRLSVMAAAAAAAAAPAVPETVAPSAPAPASAPAAPAPQGVEVSAGPTAPAVQSTGPSETASKEGSRRRRRGERAVDDEDDDEDTGTNGVDHASTASLLASAAEYMRKNDYASALQIYNYARRTCKAWESPMVELKVLSNTSLCLQRLRGRLPELVSSCNEAISRIAELRKEGGKDVTEEMLLRMECACLSRRGSAYSQQRKAEESAEDAARVRELLARVAELEASGRPAPAG